MHWQSNNAYINQCDGTQHKTRAKKERTYYPRLSFKKSYVYQQVSGVNGLLHLKNIYTQMQENDIMTVSGDAQMVY